MKVLEDFLGGQSPASESSLPSSLLPEPCVPEVCRQSKELTADSSYGTSSNASIVPDLVHYQPVLQPKATRKKVFVVHGHNTQLKLEVARLIDRLGFESIVFHEQRLRGRSILQKLIELTDDVVYGVVLYTACDTGKAHKEELYQPRARQNVVFEHGFLMAKLGQDKVTAIKEPLVAAPSDLDGVLYISTDDDWKFELSEELRALV
ncbi:hypothetical protein AU498_06830 [Lonsdalea populi]|uniref:TIR domain-containing protein n=2 Tax=Pectobacteriaceae TaxID=1903410 RepID=UPI000DCA8805|nr:nucleotide-binding protein [Lonsdalea populi]RAT53300.1 hypothetical protein AU498_06830 [Lonsdalea populi]RAT54932.1 hypothetical protein AU497_03365 [Lonsdalea populi]